MSAVLDFIQSTEVLIVFKWWALWQCFDFCLTRLKVKLRKPWVLSK
jgi:hypothetical protein